MASKGIFVRSVQSASHINNALLVCIVSHPTLQTSSIFYQNFCFHLLLSLVSKPLEYGKLADSTHQNRHKMGRLNCAVQGSVSARTFNPSKFGRVYKKSAVPLDFRFECTFIYTINPLNPELNPICYLLALLGAHHFFHVSRIRVKLLTFRLLMSYIHMEHPFLMILDHTQRRSTVGRTPLDE